MGLGASALTATYRRRPQKVHNHPSQQPEPSAEDVALTRRLHEAGALLGINVIDHVIVTAEGRYRSLADDGVLGAGR